MREKWLQEGLGVESATLIAELESSLKGHHAAMKQLERVHDGQLRPYCTLLKERIESTILPVIEDAMVAVQTSIA